VYFLTSIGGLRKQSGNISRRILIKFTSVIASWQKPDTLQPPTCSFTMGV
jgi:hypothetical protein